MKPTSISPGIVNIPTPQSISAERKAQVERLLEKYKPSEWLKREFRQSTSTSES